MKEILKTVFWFQRKLLSTQNCNLPPSLQSIITVRMSSSSLNKPRLSFTTWPLLYLLFHSSSSPPRLTCTQWLSPSSLPKSGWCSDWVWKRNWTGSTLSFATSKASLWSAESRWETVVTKWARFTITVRNWWVTLCGWWWPGWQCGCSWEWLTLWTNSSPRYQDLCNTQITTRWQSTWCWVSTFSTRVWTHCTITRLRAKSTHSIQAYQSPYPFSVSPY